MGQGAHALIREASGFTDLLDRSSGGFGVGGRMVMVVVRGGGERERWEMKKKRLVDMVVVI